jgi:TRAP-type uncharacterized transport system substrate-binding protein
MKRRSLLQAGLAMAGATLLTGLSPYPQWYALGPKYWRIVAARGNAGASRLAGAVSALLAARVPGSQAIPAEAETERDVLQLLRTHEVELAILSIDAANDALSGSGASFPDGAVALRTVAPFGPHLLVALESYSTDKAARIAAALAGFRWQDGSVPTRGSGPQSKVPLHPGAIRFKQARESKMGE